MYSVCRTRVPFYSADQYFQIPLQDGWRGMWWRCMGAELKASCICCDVYIFSLWHLHPPNRAVILTPVWNNALRLQSLCACLIMKVFAASLLALAPYVMATPTPGDIAPLEARQSLPSINYRSFVSGGCSGSGTVFNSRVNACSVLPGASTRLETRPGICVGE